MKNHRNIRSKDVYIWCEKHGKVKMPDRIGWDDVTMYCIMCEEELREIENDIKGEKRYANYIHE